MGTAGLKEPLHFIQCSPPHPPSHPAVLWHVPIMTHPAERLPCWFMGADNLARFSCFLLQIWWIFQSAVWDLRAFQTTSWKHSSDTREGVFVFFFVDLSVLYKTSINQHITIKPLNCGPSENFNYLFYILYFKHFVLFPQKKARKLCKIKTESSQFSMKRRSPTLEHSTTVPIFRCPCTHFASNSE